MKRTPLKRKTPLRRSGRLARKPYRWKGRDDATLEADRLWARKVHARGKCEICEAIKVDAMYRDTCLEAHHARGRSRRFRWRLDVGMLLCRWHHRESPSLSAHGAPAAFRAWVERNRPAIMAAVYPVETAATAIERLSR